MKSIVPISEISPEMLTRYLQVQSNYFRDRDVSAVRWKYYDEAFNRGRGRGLAWLRDGRVRGFVGIVPAQLQKGREVDVLNWTCDWGLEDPEATPGVGALILKKAIATFPNTATFGGGKNTKTLVPRMAAQTYADSAMRFWRPLRAGSLLHLASLRRPAVAPLARSPLGRLGIPWLWPRLRPRRDVRFAQNVFGGLDALFDASAPTEWTTRYDVHYLTWALERCPGIESATAWVESDRGPLAATVMWASTSREIPHVRFAHWSVPGAEDALADTIAETILRARARGAALISTVVETHDAHATTMLRSAGFFAHPDRLPLFILSKSLPKIAGMSYFAADAAQRFTRER